MDFYTPSIYIGIIWRAVLLGRFPKRVQRPKRKCYKLTDVPYFCRNIHLKREEDFVIVQMEPTSYVADTYVHNIFHVWY